MTVTTDAELGSAATAPSYIFLLIPTPLPAPRSPTIFTCFFV